MISINLTRGQLVTWLASQFVGVREFGHNAGPVVERFQKAVDGRATGEPWCACFVQYVVRELAPVIASTPALFATESTQLLWAHTPTSARVAAEPGAIVVWRSKAKPLTGHCGIVSRVDGDDIVTIEGNTGAGDQREGDVVAVKHRIGGQIPGFELLGFLRAFEETK